MKGWVHSFGLLRLGYDVAVHYPFETVADNGNAVAGAQNGPATPLGFKLRFTDNSQGIIVPTYAFVDIKTPQENIARKQASWRAKTKAASLVEIERDEAEVVHSEKIKDILAR